MSTSSDSREFLDLFYRDGMVIMGAEGQNPTKGHVSRAQRQELEGAPVTGK